MKISAPRVEALCVYMHAFICVQLSHPHPPSLMTL